MLRLMYPKMLISETEVVDRIVQASAFAEEDPLRTATHHKAIMNGISPVLMVTNN